MLRRKNLQLFFWTKTHPDRLHLLFDREQQRYVTKQTLVAVVRDPTMKETVDAAEATGRDRTMNNQLMDFHMEFVLDQIEAGSMEVDANIDLRLDLNDWGNLDWNGNEDPWRLKSIILCCSTRQWIWWLSCWNRFHLRRVRRDNEDEYE